MLSINNRPQMYLDKGLCCMFWYTYLVEMSSSWNFLARASSSYEDSEPSWGTLIFELKPS